MKPYCDVCNRDINPKTQKDPSKELCNPCYLRFYKNKVTPAYTKRKNEMHKALKNYTKTRV